MAMLHICSHFQRQTGCRRLALAGGVALNCTTNGKLMRSDYFEEIYVQPASGDDGTALGAALQWAAKHDRVCNRRLPVPFFGPLSTEGEVMSALAKVVAEMTFGSDAAFREQVLKDFSEEVSRFELEFRESDMTSASTSGARH